MQQPPTVRRRPKHSRHVLSYWSLEIATVLAAILLLAAIIGLLSYYDGRYMPDWPFQINLNSAIAFLTTFLRAAIVAAVAEIIGQTKWTWFTERTRPLHHLQTFDSASRSVLGSLRLIAVVLWNYSFTSAGLLGVAAAMVTIASLAVGPLTQQAIKTTSCLQLMSRARSAIPVANYVPGTSSYYRVSVGLYELEVDMKSTMIQGITDPDGGQESSTGATCNTGNCAWPDYGTGITHASIGLCSACIDATDFVSAPDMGGNLTLPDEGAFINFSPGGQNMWMGYSNLSAYEHLFSDDFAKQAAVSVSNFSILATSTSPCTKDDTTGQLTCPHRISQSNNSYYQGLGDYVAATCILYPCMKEFWARYENNEFTEKLVSTQVAIPNTAETTDYTLFYNYTAVKSPCVLDDGTCLDFDSLSSSSSSSRRDMKEDASVPNACLYKMDGIFFYAVSNFLSNTLFSGSCIYDSEQSGHLDCGDAWWLTPLWVDMNATFSTIDAAIGDFSRAVTNKFRRTGAGPNLLLGEQVTQPEVYGTVYETSTCTYFDRKWMSLSIILVALCAVLLAWIAINNYRDPEQPVWKGSVLPLLFFGLHEPGSSSSSSSSPSSSNADAKQAYLQPSVVERVPDRPERISTASFRRENGRAAPELDKIQDEAGRMWVRFHGGTDPGFVHLEAMEKRNP
ncbi:hypothetical protein M406DRAFT_264942 [Cryphonectria parasitica EP155]|uniref:Uncharacterized protein n=1 Tax=Cryphonectria parasitica (strain ATCC 38755 / EP155) TaxID=660469 RepID=A0A9P4XWB3_CRYP1|nr:uncharacterized protein M406DRAFT_264942 [Cryphonectria parasitica EP155]KAF3762474.1 hypothetical protein M406DRAFT_264942 [Cryphonectria parasitica EP155]